ncbi:Hypothetical predicted protein [Cloeon dipterum]|uniref:C-type lectin domain-containing protein n=1 Tax=Cloeon dipterum TaxID=197152 RepID=A0A8S1DS71_9INSE|nr:Hypothetical predicted protein [Cloeon dipterum]
MVLVNRLLIQVLFLLSLLVDVEEVWGAKIRRKKWTSKPLKNKVKILTTIATVIKQTTKTPKNEGPFQFCNNYNRIKKSVQDTAISEDFIVGKRDGITELFDVRDPQFGGYTKQGTIGLRYTFDGAETVEYDRAVEACLFRKLHLLALDTPDEIANLYFILGTTLYEEVEFLWTSAAPCSKSDPLNKATKSCSSLTWCPNNAETRLNYKLNLRNFTPPYCIIYRNKIKRFEPMDCAFKAHFSCESECTRPILPSQNECQKDGSLFEKIGGKTYLKKEHGFRGTWEQNELGFYFFGEKFVNWQENWMTCCRLGLKPLALINTLLDHLDTPNIIAAMQGVVHWTAMTRAGCPLHFENFLHNESETFFLAIYGIQKGGSCVAGSIRDPKAAEILGPSLAVKTTICASKLLLGCEGKEKTFEIRDFPSNCDLPECKGLPDCVMKDELFLTQPFRVLLASWSFGKWHSYCDNSILELQNEYGTWDEAYKRCCSLGMDLLSVHNPAKQDCFGNPYKNSNPNEKGYLPFRTEAWTAGRDIESCRGQLRWCTGYLNDYLKKDLKWKQGHDPRFANNSCVYIDFGDPDFPSLALADCSEKKQIICEAPTGVGFKSQMHYQSCRRNSKVEESEAEKMWNTGDLSRTSFSVKKMIQCVAEHIGLVYNSTQINLHVYLRWMSRMVDPINFASTQKVKDDQRAFFLSFEAEFSDKKLTNTVKDVLVNDALDDLRSAHFDFTTEMMKKLYECKGIKIANKESFAFDFLMCLLQSREMDRFWKLYDFNLEQRSVMPADRDLNLPCMTFDNFLKSDSSLCIPAGGLFRLTEAAFLTQSPIIIEMSSSFTACLERNGSLPYAETKEEFETIYNYIRGVAPNLTIIWDQGFYDKLNTKFMWCRSELGRSQPGANIPIPVTVNATAKQDFVMLVSLPGAKPNLHAVSATEQLKYQTDVFCRIPKSVVVECLTNNPTGTSEY